MDQTALASAESFAAQRTAMIVSQLRPNNVTDPRLLAAIDGVDREDYLPPERRAAAYIDRAVELGNGRALNPPLTTALLLDAVRIAPGDRVLIVGTATGYAAAVASHLGATVVGVEVDEDLAAWARKSVPAATIELGHLNEGVANHGPFDVIVIDGAVESVSEVIVGQLAGTGRLACAIVENGVTRLAVGRHGGGAFALSVFADMEAVRLPGFAQRAEFVF